VENATLLYFEYYHNIVQTPNKLPTLLRLEIFYPAWKQEDKAKYSKVLS